MNFEPPAFNVTPVTQRATSDLTIALSLLDAFCPIFAPMC